MTSQSQGAQVGRADKYTLLVFNHNNIPKFELWKSNKDPANSNAVFTKFTDPPTFTHTVYRSRAAYFLKRTVGIKPGFYLFDSHPSQNKWLKVKKARNIYPVVCFRHKNNPMMEEWGLYSSDKLNLTMASVKTASVAPSGEPDLFDPVTYQPIPCSFFEPVDSKYKTTRPTCRYYPTAGGWVEVCG